MPLLPRFEEQIPRPRAKLRVQRECGRVAQQRRDEPRRTPLEMALMRLGPMAWVRDHVPLPRAPDVGGDALALAKDLDRRRGEAYVDGRTDERARDAVELHVDGDV